jgi:hypothetical protein
VVRSRQRDAGIIELTEGTMGLAVESLAQQFSFDVGVPVVLYPVDRPPGKSPRNKRPPVQFHGLINISSIHNWNFKSDIFMTDPGLICLYR